MTTCYNSCSCSSDTINKAPTSIPGIMSALRYQFNMRCVHNDVTAAFDHSLILAAKAGVARRPYEPKVRLPCSYAMIQHIVQRNTQDGFTMDNLMLAVGVFMAYHLCLRISEYASKTKILINSILNRWSFSASTNQPYSLASRYEQYRGTTSS